VPPGLGQIAPIGNIGRYQVLGKIAQGGMAEIFLGFEEGPRETRRPVVIKRVLPHVAEDADYVEQFLQEASLSLRLRHPNICTIYEFGEDKSRYFLAMEYLHGVTLDQIVAKSGKLPAPLAARVVALVAEGLAHAHELRDDEGRPLGLVHRDVTPENVMIGFDGTVKLLDFGIAKSANQQSRTQAGVLKGKVAYMSPEQYKGEPLDGRSDLFALGATLFKALTGRSPFERDNEANTVAAILFEDPPAPSEVLEGVPPDLDALVVRMLAKDPDDRPMTAGGVAAELDAWLAAKGVAVRSSDIGTFLGVHFRDRKDVLPKLDRGPVTGLIEVVDPLATAQIQAELDDVLEATQRAEKRKKMLVAVLAAVTVLGALGAAAWKVANPPPPDPTETESPITP